MNPDLAALCTPDCPELAPVVTGLQSEGRPVAVCRAALGHLADPTMPAAELASDAGATLEDVPAAYGLLRGDRAVAALTASMFYPHRLKHRLAVRTVAEWSAEPARFARLLAGEPVLSQTVEIHPSKGTCNYRCAMCLWSDKTTLTYATRGLKARGLLSTQQWLDTIEDLRAHGVQTLVISGGGEALLNPDLPVILRRARNLGLRTQLYTTGYNLRHAAPDLWEEIARTHRVRLSIHSPLPATYAQITGLPTELHALRRVSEHAQRLLDLRDRLGSPLRLGIGFVLMAVNHGEILAMADFAAELGADFLDIRKDEVDVNLALMPQPVEDMLDAIGRTFVPDACAQCMPSSRTTNAVYAKLLRDARDGLKLCDQPFHDPPPTANERAPSRL